MHFRNLAFIAGLLLASSIAQAAPQEVGFNKTIVSKGKVKALYKSLASPFKKCGGSSTVVGDAMEFELKEDMFVSVRIVESGTTSAIGIEHMETREAECDYSRVIRRQFKKGRYTVYGIGSPKNLKKHAFTVEVKTNKKPKVKKKTPAAKVEKNKEVLPGQSAKRALRTFEEPELLVEGASMIDFKFGKSGPFSHAEKVSVDDDVFFKCKGSGGFNVHKMPLANAMKVTFDRLANVN